MIKKIKPIIHYLKYFTVEQWLLFGLIALYISCFTFFTFQNHHLFFTGRYDLGNMDQTVWNTLHGRIFLFTHPEHDEVMSRLSVHSDFILIFLAPFYLLWEDARVLLLIQTIVIALGALFIYLLSQKIIHRPLLPLILALSYLLNPYVQRQNLFDFHPVTLATTFLLGAFYFLKSNKLIPFFAFLSLAVLTKEHIFLIAALFGLYIFIFQKKKWGIALTALSSLIFYLLVSMLIPQALGHEHFALAHYKNLGGSPLQIILTAAGNPLTLAQILTKHNLISYLQHLLLPAGFLPLLSPGFLLLASPEFFINMLSNNWTFRSYYYHYSAATLPFIYISTIFGIKKLLDANWKLKIGNWKLEIGNWKFFLLSFYLLTFSLFSTWYFGPLPGTRRPSLAIFKTNLNPQPIHRYLRQIPPETPVAATNNLAAHLVHRQKIYTLSNFQKAQLILFLVPDIHNQNNSEVRLIEQLKNNPSYQIAYHLDNFIVFKPR